jgi:ABC-type uncharacterized transport system permease subunit
MVIAVVLIVTTLVLCSVAAPKLQSEAIDTITRGEFGALPAVLVITALSYLLYTLTDHLISGVLLAFFVTVVLCFIGGCMYPVQIFPESVQQLAAVLPSGLARQSLTGCYMGAGPGSQWALAGYGAAFLTLAAAIRGYKAGKVSG